VGDAQHQDVDGRLAQIPVGAVEGDDPRGGRAGEPHDQAGDLRVGQREVAQEAPDALVVRGRLRPPAEDAGDLCKVNRLDLDDGDEEARQEVEARTVPRYILGERPLQEADVGHRALSSDGSFGDELVKDRGAVAFSTVSKS
jgi:hypothetical protein